VGTQLYTSTFVLEKDASLGEYVLASDGEENIQCCADGLHDDRVLLLSAQCEQLSVSFLHGQSVCTFRLWGADTCAAWQSVEVRINCDKVKER
jgi:hypothetical protein